MSQDAITEVPANVQNIQDETLRQLVQQNIEWAQKVKVQEPAFFSEGSKVQHPKVRRLIETRGNVAVYP